MELYTEFSNLKIDEHLFKDVKFYITGSIPDWIIKLLINGGAKQESHITDFMTHLIAGVNPDKNDIEVVKDIYERPIVTHHWVTYSAKCQRKLPVEAFRKDGNQVFSGVKATISKLDIKDSRAVWGLINFYGGKCNLDLDHTCTHLIVGKPEGIKFNRALEKTIIIVTPDWVTESVTAGKRRDESDYHPKLLKQSPSPVQQVPHKKPQKAKTSQKSKKQPVTSVMDFSSEDSFLTNKVEESLKSSPSKVMDKNSLFDSLVFSDGEDDNETERKSLLEQLKNSQPWKKSPTPPSSLLLPLDDIKNVSSMLDQTLSPSPKSIIPTDTDIQPNNKKSPSLNVSTTAGDLLMENLTTTSLANIPTSSKNLPPISTASSSKLVSQTESAPQPLSVVSQSLPITSNTSFTNSLRSTSEVDISFISKHLSQITSGSGTAQSQQMNGSSVAFHTTAPSSSSHPSSPFPEMSKSDVQMKSMPKSITHSSQIQNKLQLTSSLHSSLPSGTYSKPSITVSHGLISQRQTSSGLNASQITSNLPSSNQAPITTSSISNINLFPQESTTHSQSLITSQSLAQPQTGGIVAQVQSSQKVLTHTSQAPLQLHTQPASQHPPFSSRPSQLVYSTSVPSSQSSRTVQLSQVSQILPQISSEHQSSQPITQQSTQSLSQQPMQILSQQLSQSSPRLSVQSSVQQNISSEDSVRSSIQLVSQHSQISSQTNRIPTQILSHTPSKLHSQLQNQTSQSTTMSLSYLDSQQLPQLQNQTSQPQSWTSQTPPVTLSHLQSSKSIMPMQNQTQPQASMSNQLNEVNLLGSQVETPNITLTTSQNEGNNSHILQSTPQAQTGSSAPLSALSQQTLIGANTGLPTAGQVVSSNAQIIQQGTPNSQTTMPIQLVRQNSVSVIGNQVNVHGPPNATVRSIGAGASQISISGVKPGVGPLTQTQQSANQISNSPGPNATQQQVHSVAIPGAVVRLPSGVTQQQLQMMSSEERHKFLEQLHKKQLQEQHVQQQQRGKPRAGKPVTALQYKGIPPGAVRYAGNIRAQVSQSQTTSAGAWPVVSQGRVRSGALATNQSTGFVQDQTKIQSPASAPVSWQQQSPQQPSQSPQSQQQFISVQGTANRVAVGQAGWQQQQQVSGSGQPQTQTLLPQQIQQVQLHAQQLRQHFPHLTQPEAQQLIQTIPTHLREILSRDAAGRYEYLSSLEPKEREVVNHFYVRRQQQQQQLLQRQQLQAQQQAQLKIGTPQHSPNTWAQQQQSQTQPGQQPPPPPPPQPGGPFPTLSPHARALPGRPLPQGYSGQTVVSPGQGSPHLIQGNQLTPHVSPLASPHGHSPIQRSNDGSAVLPHQPIQGSGVAQNILSPQNSKIKTALANLLTNRLSGSSHLHGSIPQGGQGPIEVAHIVQQKPGETITGSGGEQVLVYQRRTLANINTNMANNIVRSQVHGGSPASGILGSSYPRTSPAGQPSGQNPGLTQGSPHYPRPHLFGHDINTMLPRELCMVGCVFYIADYHSDITPSTLNVWKRVIQQHGGEVVNLYDSVRVTHVLCKHQKSPVFQQAVRENKRCITIYWVNDILIRGKMAPPWQAIHLPTPFDHKDLPMKDLLVSVTGFENDERTTIKLMLHLAGAKYTGYFSKHNNLLVCKKFEGMKVIKAKEWKRAVVNGMWLSEVLLGQNTPPLVYQGTRYQHYLDDPLRIDPSLASHLFNAWKFPISVSKESVEKAKCVREMALRKRKSENDVPESENKRSRLDAGHLPQLPLNNPTISSDASSVVPSSPSFSSDLGGPNNQVSKRNSNNSDARPRRILLSSLKNKEDLEKKVVSLGAVIVQTNSEATHLVMGAVGTAPRTVKLMCAVSCSNYILSSQWILDSHAQDNFLGEEKYALRMPEFESLFSFRLQDTLLKPNRRELLRGLQFYLTPSVIPSRTWLKEIIECAGGAVDARRKTLQEAKERNRDGLKYLCITTPNDSHLIKDILKEKLPVYNSEFILISILRQRVDFDFGLFSEDADS